LDRDIFAHYSGLVLGLGLELSGLGLGLGPLASALASRCLALLTSLLNAGYRVSVKYFTRVALSAVGVAFPIYVATVPESAA